MSGERKPKLLQCTSRDETLSFPPFPLLLPSRPSDLSRSEMSLRCLTNTSASATQTHIDPLLPSSHYQSRRFSQSIIVTGNVVHGSRCRSSRIQSSQPRGVMGTQMCLGSQGTESAQESGWLEVKAMRLGQIVRLFGRSGPKSRRQRQNIHAKKNVVNELE